MSDSHYLLGRLKEAHPLCNLQQAYLPHLLPLHARIGAIGALMNRVRQPRPLVVLGLNVWMGTAAGADELVEVPYG